VHIQAYLRVLSDENTIRAIHAEAGLPKANIKQLKARRGVAGENKWWNWETARTPIDIDNPDEGLKALLYFHRPIFPVIRKYCGPETDVYLELVAQYEENEEPQGLYLSSETVQLLSEMGAALDLDVVTLARKSDDGG
jgi:hypothetical protein